MARPHVGEARLVLAALLVVAAVIVAPSADAAVRSAEPYDFNGDGFADLAVGVPGEDDGSTRDSGAVNVIYGSREGLSARGDQLWSQDSRGVPGRAEVGDRFGTVASGDFDGDGYADLAVGAPGETLGKRSEAGGVTVLYGTRHGLASSRSRSFTQSTLGVPGSPDVRGRFGAALAAGDFNGDHRTDLAIGAPRDDVGPENDDHGSVTVLLGGAHGLSTRGVQVWDSGPLGPGGGLGEALEAADVDGDGRADLVLMDASGFVTVLRGARRGLTSAGLQVWDRGSTGLSAAMGQPGFFESLALGDFNGDRHPDLAVGAPSADREIEGDDCEEDAWCDGAVVVLPSVPGGLFTTHGSQVLHWGVPGVSGNSTGLGRRLAAGDLDGNGVDELCAAAGDGDHGVDVVAIAFAPGAGIRAASSTSWHPVPGSVPPNPDDADDSFGNSMRVAQLGHGSEADLAIAAPGVTLGEAASAGEVIVRYGSSRGLTRTGEQTWSQETPGVRGKAETGDGFGLLDG
jgi:hypothetical protein